MQDLSKMESVGQWNQALLAKMNDLTENGKVYHNSPFDEYAYESIYNQIIDELK